MTVRRVLLVVLAAVCGIAGAWIAPRIAGPPTYETDVATLRMDLAVSSPSDRGVSLFIPLADWGLRAQVVGAPVEVRVEPRVIDRAAVVGMATGGTQDVVRGLRSDIDSALRRLAVRTGLLMLLGAAVGGLVALLAWHALGIRGRGLLIAPVAAIGVVVVLVGVLAAWSAATWKPDRLDHPSYFASGGELGDILDQAAALRRAGGKYSDRVDNAIRGIAGLLNRRESGGSGALGSPASPSAEDTMRVVLASDIHNNLLALRPLRAYAEGHPAVLAGDFTINGGKMEAPLVRAMADFGDPVVAVSGNHDSPGIMDTLAGEGVTVLDHADGVRTIAGLRMAGFEDPLEFRGKRFPGGLRTGLSFGDLPDGDELLQRAIEERWRWWQALPERPDVLIVHQESIGRALADRIWKAEPEGEPLTILVAHTHVQRMDVYGPVTTVNSGSAGAGGVWGIGSQSVGIALMDFDRANGDLTSVDLVQMTPSTSAARAQRVVIASPECDDELVFCHEAPEAEK